ncbi:cell envelope integrity protein TolA [Paucibacter sp. R3-3]|uniref:Cell envelope integrity protein TolA n=1 Tax=Roseateles agri TaxID=3098619 RepID=A0ABU5DK06_9BURK|nr:cell envelope integrity protein TolA [Paucibacter sp. R3-3]MDY0745589.1 cell envelope integrity protein TolA [Paucibacter sp. R3-3]
MTAAAFQRRGRDPFRPPEAPGLGRGMVFALVAHVLLVVAISANIQWRTKTLPTAEAELWSAVPQAAAPKEVLPPPEPEPEVKPTPKPPEPQPPSAEEIKAQRDADIAIAKQKKQREDDEAKKRLAEQEELKKQKALKDKAEKDKADKERLEKDKADKLKAQQQQAQQDKAKDAKAQKDADAKREAQRQDNLKRIMGMAGASGGENARGTAQKSSGPSATYGGRVVARVKPNIVYGDVPAGNPAAEVEVRVAPDGTIIGRKIIKASGLPDWDSAVLRAIDKTETLPRDTDGTVPSVLVISFRPRD